VIRPFDGDDFPNPKTFSHVILTGGNGAKTRKSVHNYERELGFIRTRHELGLPLLGVCLGMHIIAEGLGGEDYVRIRSSSEIGWIRIKRTSPSRLLNDLPMEFSCFANHTSEVIKAPDGFIVTARSRRVDIQAFEHKHKPTFAVQFHPEKTPTKALSTVHRRKRQDIPSRWFIDPYSISKYDRNIGQKIFDNFFNSK
jgi:GMP synthase (glutamine-hydrolysing)